MTDEKKLKELVIYAGKAAPALQEADIEDLLDFFEVEHDDNGQIIWLHFDDDAAHTWAHETADGDERVIYYKQAADFIAENQDEADEAYSELLAEGGLPQSLYSLNAALTYQIIYSRLLADVYALAHWLDI